VLSAWPYLPRAFAAIFLPGHDRRRYMFHARQALRPERGAGLREAAEEYNRAVPPAPAAAEGRAGSGTG
jgi:hypothetical protein